MTIKNSCVLYVCSTCKKAGGCDAWDQQSARPGAKMLEALQGEPLPEGVAVRAVECLSACSRGCAVALTAPGKWTFVYGDLDPAQHVRDIVRGAELFAHSLDGLPPWRERPEIFRKQCLARIPSI